MKPRKMAQDDLATVVKIERAANHFPWSKKNFEDCLKAHHHAWVFEDDNNEIMGFTIVQQVVDEAHLLTICIKPNKKRQGLGRVILNYVTDFANRISSVMIILEVRRSNRGAQQLYLSAGFNEMSVRKNYYPASNGREDAIIMGMDLSF